MQMGMIGLGRMGANMVRRLRRGRDECVVFDVSAAAVKELARGRHWRVVTRRFRRQAQAAARGVDDGAGLLPSSSRRWRTCRADFSATTSSSTAAFVLHRRHPARRILRRKGDSLCRFRHQRWRLGTRERGFCHMIGGEPQVVKHLDLDFRHARAVDRSAAHRAEKVKGSTRGARLSALRTERRRPLRQNGVTTESSTESWRTRRG